MSELAIDVQHVVKRYADHVAVKDLTLAVPRGTVYGLLGPNGAGKTTAVRVLLGLAAADTGSATICGHAPDTQAAKLRRGALLQVAKVPETLRVREHIELFSCYYPKPLPTAETIEAAGLRGIEDRLFGDLSGGQKQRVLFALALCGNPDLLFLDEPTAGLDVEARRGLWARIRAFVARGGSVLLTTHYIEEADALANRIAVINHGRIVAEGSPAEIKARTSHTGLEDAFLELVNQEVN